MQWSAHSELILNHVVNDVLILLDCCCAAGMSGTATGGTKEVIAACGSDTWTPGNQDDSFTKGLTEVLRAMEIGPPFSVVHLDDHLL